MTALARLAGLICPACAEQGAAGLPIPLPARPLRTGRPDAVVTRDSPLPVRDLAHAVAAAGAAMLRTFPHAFYDEPCQLHFVVRSRRLNLPFTVTADIAPATSGSRLTLVARGPRPWCHLGATQRRLLAWSRALDGDLHPATR